MTNACTGVTLLTSHSSFPPSRGLGLIEVEIRFDPVNTVLYYMSEIDHPILH